VGIGDFVVIMAVLNAVEVGALVEAIQHSSKKVAS
jgi:hypothetical protein